MAINFDNISDVEELRQEAKIQNGLYVREAEKAQRLELQLQEKENAVERLFNINNGHLDTIAYLANKVMKLEMALDVQKKVARR